MFIKMIINDIKRNKLINLALVLFIFISALFLSSGVSIISKLTYSIDYLFLKSNAPHFVQMHAGEIDQQKIDQWSMANDLVKHQQTVEMINIDGASLFLGNSLHPERNSIMDNSFVKQNEQFDYLLSLENERVQVSAGEIGVPIYYKEKNALKIGDNVTIIDGDFSKQFVIRYFIRDALMNPAIVHSKRFLVHPEDFQEMNKTVGEKEYLIQYHLTDINRLPEFHTNYHSSGLPKTGPTIDYQTFKLLNAITDGLIAALIIFVSFLFIIMSLLSMRLVIVAAIEEDYREIGILKAIGIKQTDIKSIYLMKYVFIAAIACLIGYFGSTILTPFLTQNMMQYLGAPPTQIVTHLVSLLACLLIFLVVSIYCRFTLRRFNKITVVEVIRIGKLGDVKMKKRQFSIKNSKWIGVNLLLGFKDIVSRWKIYMLLLIVFSISTFIIIVPVHFLSTMQSPTFINYMGIGKSDIRIDLQPSTAISQRPQEIISYLETDDDVKQFTPLITSRYQVIGSDGGVENINIETGDFSIFPLKYEEGRAPTNQAEIALSYLTSKELGKRVGDTIVVVTTEGEIEVNIKGIYQDITNGGRTAKALLPVNDEEVLWYVIMIDLKTDINFEKKMKEYTDVFHPVKVTNIQRYLNETLGDTIKQLRTLTIISISLALFVSILMTALFLKMIIAKDSAEIATMKSIGFSIADLQKLYSTRVFCVLVTSIIIGVVASNTLGQRIVSALWSFMGASKIQFVINPIFAYVICPFMIMATVIVTTLVSTDSINPITIRKFKG